MSEMIVPILFGVWLLILIFLAFAALYFALVPSRREEKRLRESWIMKERDSQ